MADGARPRQSSPVPARPPRSCASGDAAADLALAPLAFGEAPRVGVLGDSGTGKTHAMNHLVAAYLRRSPGIVLVVDDKELRARFAGQERRDVAELAERPLQKEPRVVVFRGSLREGIEANPEEIAAFAWRVQQRGFPSLVVYDELDKATTHGQWKSGTVWIPRSFGQGRAVGIASLWGTQSPQSVPLQPFEQSSVIVCFRLAGQGLNKLRERDYLEGGVSEVIERLPGDDVPPAQRGQFVLLRRGRPWDGVVYRF